MSMTLEEALKRDVVRRMNSPELYRLYSDETGPTASAELFWRGLCVKLMTPPLAPPQYCGEPYDAKSPLGHCTEHIEPDV